MPLIRQNVSHAQKYRRLIANNQKQFTIVFPYRRFLAFALLLVANISCVLFAIIGDWSGMNVKGVSIYRNCL